MTKIRNPKSEARSPKSMECGFGATLSRFGLRNSGCTGSKIHVLAKKSKHCRLRIRNSDFGLLSDFGFRISDFGWSSAAVPGNIPS